MYILVNTYKYNVRYIGVSTWTYTKRIRTCRESRRKRESRERKQGSKSPPEIFFEKSREIFRRKLDNSDQPLVQSQNSVYPLLALRRRRKRIDAKETCRSTWMKKNRKIRVSRMQQFGAWIAEEETRAGGDAERRNAVICIEMFCCCRENCWVMGKELDWRRSEREKTQTRGYVFWFFYRSLKLELMLKDFRGRWTLGGFCSLFIFIRVSSCWASVSASRMLMR